jgi:integrase
MNAMSKKTRGGQAHYIIDPRTKKPVVGLSYDTSLKYFYLTHWRTDGYQKRPVFGRRGCDPIEAINAYHQWITDHGKSPTVQVSVPDFQNTFFSAYNQVIQKISNNYGKSIDGQPIDQSCSLEISENESFKIIKSAIKADKSRVENLLGIHFVVNDAGTDYNLSDIINHFASRQKFIDKNDLTNAQKKELHEIKKSWQTFSDNISKTLIGEISKQDIIKYRDYIAMIVKNNSWSTTTHRKYYEHIKRVLNFAVREMDNVEKIQQVQNWCIAHLRPPKKVIKYPSRRITGIDFRHILENANIEERAMFLISANCAYIPIDIVKLPLSKIDLDKKICVFRRVKNGIHRSAVLWDETVSAIKEYLQIILHHNPDTDPLFICQQHRGEYSEQVVSFRFKTICDKLKLPYQHKYFRATAESVCDQHHIDFITVNALMGHDQKIKTHYLDPEIYPELTKICADTLHQWYFDEK